MTEVKSVFSEVYNIAFSKTHSLFVALDRENVLDIILDGNTYWTEQGTYSVGLNNLQQIQLAKIMTDIFGAKEL